LNKRPEIVEPLAIVEKPGEDDPADRDGLIKRHLELFVFVSMMFFFMEPCVRMSAIQSGQEHGQ
jgi:hypothetical protein